MVSSAFLRRIAAARILHGKEAVPGSNPGEGLNTCKSAYSEKCGVPPDHGGPGASQREGAENSLLIMRCSGSAEHFPEREGLDVVAVAWRAESRWNRRHSRSRC